MDVVINCLAQGRLNGRQDGCPDFWTAEWRWITLLG